MAQENDGEIGGIKFSLLNVNATEFIPSSFGPAENTTTTPTPTEITGEKTPENAGIY